LQGSELRVSACKNCTIVLLDHVSACSVDGCEHCDFILCSVSTSVFIRDTRECRFTIAAAQFRCRNLSDSKLFLYCKTEPVIESSRDLTFSPFSLRVSGLSVEELSAPPPPAGEAEERPPASTRAPPGNAAAIAKARQLEAVVVWTMLRARLAIFTNYFERIFNFTPDYARDCAIIVPRPAEAEQVQPPLAVLPAAAFSTDTLVFGLDKALACSSPFPQAGPACSGAVAEKGCALTSCWLPYGVVRPEGNAGYYGEELAYVLVPSTAPEGGAAAQHGAPSGPPLAASLEWLRGPSRLWSPDFERAIAARGMHVRRVIPLPPRHPSLKGLPLPPANAESPRPPAGVEPFWFALVVSGKSNVMFTLEDILSRPSQLWPGSKDGVRVASGSLAVALPQVLQELCGDGRVL